MKEKNRHILKKAIGEMPVHRLPNEFLWERIIESRANHQALPDRLPTFKAPEGVWENIAKELNNKPAIKPRRALQYVRLAAAITGIIMMLGTGWIMIRNQSGNATRQIAVSGLNNSVTDKVTQSPLVYDPGLCRSNPRACNTKLFKELDRQWHDVKKELEMLEPEIRHNDPQLTGYFYRLDNLKIEIEKKMLKLILES